MTTENKFELIAAIRKSKRWIDHKQGHPWNGYKVTVLSTGKQYNIMAEAIYKDQFGTKVLAIIADDIWIPESLALSVFEDTDTVLYVYE